MPWRRAICAAEELFFIAAMASDPAAKLLGLTFGNGHGVAAGIDGDGREQEETVVSPQEEEDKDAPAKTAPEDWSGALQIGRNMNIWPEDETPAGVQRAVRLRLAAASAIAP